MSVPAHTSAPAQSSRRSPELGCRGSGALRGLVAEAGLAAAVGLLPLPPAAPWVVRGLVYAVAAAVLRPDPPAERGVASEPAAA